MSRARYAPDLSRRFGTRREDPLNPGVPLPGEFNQDGRPMGTPRPAAPSALTRFQLSQPNRAAASPASPRALPAPAKDEFNRPTMPPPQLSAPSPSPVAASRPAMIPSHPDDRALLAETRARDAAARQPAPVSIPGGDPAARAFNGRTSTPEPGVPMTPRLAVSPDRARLDAEAARTGRVSYVPRGTPEAPAIVSDTGVSRAPAPMVARAPSAPPAGDSGYIDESSARMQGPQAQVARPVAPAVPVSAPAVAPRLSAPASAIGAGQAVRQGVGLAGRALSEVPGVLHDNVIAPAINALHAPVNFLGGLMGRKDPLLHPYDPSGSSAPSLMSTLAPRALSMAAPVTSSLIGSAVGSSYGRVSSPMQNPPSLTAKIPGMPGTYTEPTPQIPGMPGTYKDPIPGMAGTYSDPIPGMTGAPPLLTGNKPKKKATPLWDQPANQY